ncbi:MAG: ArsA-related P-loop ATPase [Egibacteraceae bacterium]
MDVTNLLDPRVLFVTGKGGVGKSSVAAALAVASARTGRTTCLVEVEGRQTMARLFGTEPWDFTEHQFRPGLFGMSIDPEASLVEYLDMFYGARRLSKLVVGSTAVEFATTAAPGIKDVLLIGKVKEMERRRDEDGRFHYDLVVVDAPPTGRIVNFLRAPDATTELVNVGPIRTQAQSVVDMLLDAGRTHLQLVTLLEEMPVSETADSAAALRELGVTLGPILVNRVLPDRFDDHAKAAFHDLDAAQLVAVLADAGLDVAPEAAADLRALGERHLARLGLQDRMRERLAGALDLPCLELPYLHTDRFEEHELAALADIIEEAVQQ